jgi:uncharacterized protein
VASLTVRGHGLVRCEPDELELELSVSVSRPAAPEALAEAAQRAEALAAVLDRFGVPGEARGTTALFVREDVEYDPQGRPQRTGFVAAGHLTVRLRSAEALGELLRDAVEEAQVRVQGPVWRVAADNPARLEACRRAAADARRRAEAYADALGLRLGAVASAAEPSVQLHGAELGPMLAAGIGVETPRLEVSAAVEVTFAAEPG